MYPISSQGIVGPKALAKALYLVDGWQRSCSGDLRESPWTRQSRPTHHHPSGPSFLVFLWKRRQMQVINIHLQTLHIRTRKTTMIAPTSQPSMQFCNFRSPILRRTCLQYATSSLPTPPSASPPTKTPVVPFCLPPASSILQTNPSHRIRAHETPCCICPVVRKRIKPPKSCPPSCLHVMPCHANANTMANPGRQKERKKEREKEKNNVRPSREPSHRLVNLFDKMKQRSQVASPFI